VNAYCYLHRGMCLEYLSIVVNGMSAHRLWSMSRAQHKRTELTTVKRAAR
jgi:hypothetical protein